MRIRNPGDPLGMLRRPSAYQPLKTFVARNVQPQATSNIQLSGGKSRPYHYSLASTSTVPFASVEGSGGIQKEFSWGEIIEIPPGITVNVRNSSRHAGDIIIQSGQDTSNTPARISFPISFIPYGSSVDPYYFQQDGFIDTRRARRCYWVFFAQEAPADFDITTLGYYAQHTANPEGNNIFDTASWAFTQSIIAGDYVGYIPIGLSTTYPTFVTDNVVPMMLADYQRIFFSQQGDTPFSFNFAVLEYL